MNPRDAPKTMFMTNHNNLYYEIMSFGLKNTGVIYQRFIDIIFSEQIGWNLEVYINNMVVKNSDEGQHNKDLKETLAAIFLRKIDHCKY